MGMLGFSAARGMTIPYTIAVTARLARVTPQPSITSSNPFRPMLMPIVLTHDNKNSHSERAQMKLPENRVILCWTLIIVTAASAINLIIVTANYDLANLSLNKLDFTVSKVTFQNPLSNASILVGVTANTTVTVDVSSIVSSLYNEIQLRTGIGTQYQQPQNVSLT